MAELIVNTEAVLHNYRHYAENGQVIPVLKSNGYALGAKQLQTLLAQQGAALFACATADEALALAGEETDLLLLSCVHDMTLLRQLLQRRVIVSVESLAQAQAIDALHMDARIHLAVDSGFGRFGFLPEQVEDIKQVFALKGVHVCGIFSHFRCRDAAPEQFARFSQVLLALSDYPVGLRHIAATHTADIPPISAGRGAHRLRLDRLRLPRSGACRRHAGADLRGAASEKGRSGRLRQHAAAAGFRRSRDRSRHRRRSFCLPLSGTAGFLAAAASLCAAA